MSLSGIYLQIELGKQIADSSRSALESASLGSGYMVIWLYDYMAKAVAWPRARAIELALNTIERHSAAERLRPKTGFAISWKSLKSSRVRGPARKCPPLRHMEGIDQSGRMDGFLFAIHWK